MLMCVNPCEPFNKWYCNCEFLFLYICYCIQIKMSPINNTYLVYQKKFLGRILGSCYAISRDFLVTCKRNETKWHQKGKNFVFAFSVIYVCGCLFCNQMFSYFCFILFSLLHVFFVSILASVNVGL